MKIKLKRLIAPCISAAVLALCIAVVSAAGTGGKKPYADTAAHTVATNAPSAANEAENSTAPTRQVSTENAEVNEPSNAVSEEIRGIWIPYMTLTLKENERSEEAFKAKIDGIISVCAAHKINTVIIQVRPFGDAIYPSVYFPFSHIISGTQGKSTDYDPLEYIVSAAHEHHIAVHAWVNPFRISTGTTPSQLADSNPYMVWKNDDSKENDRYTLAYNGAIYYNPAYPAVRKLIIDGIRELAANYDIDGLQLDDYFYPSEETDYDKADYESYVKALSDGSKAISQQEWRKTNINLLIAGIHAAVHAINDKLLFGISPQCSFENNDKISADIASWCMAEGYIDYICPQLYVSENHPTAPFDELAVRWKETVKNSNVMLLYGLGLYKAGTDADNGSWLSSDSNLRNQIEMIRGLGCDGFVFYSYDYLEANATNKEVRNAMAVI